MQSLRRVGDNASYLVGADNVVRMVLQMPAATPLVLRSPRLNELEPVGARVRFWACEERWQEDGLRFSAYVLPADVSAQTLEAAFQCAAFGTVRQRHKAEDPRTGAVSYVIEPLLGEPVLRVFDALNALDEHIKRQNLRLNELAPGWIVMLEDEDNTLLVPQETLSEMPEAPGAPWRLTFDQLFPGLIGRLSCGERSMPLFAPGGDILDGDYYLFKAKGDDERAARFFKILYNDAQKIYGLMNTGVHPWSITRADGQRHDVEPGRVAVLRDGDVIDVMKDGAKLFSCAVRLR